MEKAMHGAHGLGYETYKQEHGLRMKVEQRRDEEHQECQRLVSSIEKKLHT
ncbi:hypothetical protein [Bacillus sp. FSL K6-3431]|uniref:hypothetical protein n=1 Tax=Bacillus sp. FSL K6-3431 TaxID=2921500 RepID=UPI0030FC4A12